MKNRWLAVMLYLVISACFVCSMGCGAERNATATNTVRVNCDRLVDDCIWALGFDEPSMLYDDTFPPYHSHSY